MTLKTRLKKIEVRINKNLDENPIPNHVFVVNGEEECEKKKLELIQQYGEENYNKSSVIFVIRAAKKESGRILTL